MKEYDESTQFGRLLIAAKKMHNEIKTPADVARHLDITQQALTNWKRRGLPANVVDSLAEEFDCNYKWLKTGIGDMRSEPIKFISSKEKDIEDIVAIVSNMTDETRKKAKNIVSILCPPKVSQVEINIANFVKSARLSIGITQDELALKLGCTKANVSAWENDRHVPSYKQLCRLSAMSGMPLPNN